MIPKIIHYCWLSNDPIPTQLNRYIQTWKDKLPDYEFKLWNFEIFDIDQSIWVKQAFQQKKYAFAADYIRLFALYNYGGIYLDMDVEVLKNFDDFLDLNTMICFENKNIERLEVAAFGVERGSKWINDCLKYYDHRPFIKLDGTFDTIPLPTIIGECIRKNGYIIKRVNSIIEAMGVNQNEIPVFSCEYFSPKSYLTGKMQISSKTYSVHHFTGSWLTPWQKFKIKLHHLLGM